MRLAPRIFTIAYCAAYAGVFFLNRPLFLYYPIPKRFAWGWAPVAGVGPAMAWYGLMASAAIVALGLALAIPDRLIDRSVRGYVWAFPVAAMAIAVILVRKFFQ